MLQKKTRAMQRNGEKGNDTLLDKENHIIKLLADCLMNKCSYCAVFLI